MSKNLSFKMGQEHDRGVIYSAGDNNNVSSNEGQILVGYSQICESFGINNDTPYFYPYKSVVKNNNFTPTKPLYDARMYLDLNSDSRIPISSYFSDYSSKLWNLSTGTEFNVGNIDVPVYFENGVPCPIDITSNFGICSTLSSKANKIVELDNKNFKLKQGVKITIAFAQSNTANEADLTLNVNDTGAKSLRLGYRNNALTIPEGYLDYGITYSLTYYKNMWLIDQLTIAGLDKSGIITTDNQVFTGNKTFKGSIFPYENNKFYLGNSDSQWYNINSQTYTITAFPDEGSNYLLAGKFTYEKTKTRTVLTLGNNVPNTVPEGIPHCHGRINIYSKLTGSSGIERKAYETADNFEGTSYLTKQTGNIIVSQEDDNKNIPSEQITYHLPFYTVDFEKLGLNDGLRYENLFRTANNNGLARLILGDDEGVQTKSISGQLKIFNNNGKSTTLVYDDEEANHQTVKYRYYDNNLNPSYLITAPSLGAVGGETKIDDETPNGDKPVYISDKGVAIACNGIVVTQEEQSFIGNKIFKDCVKINYSENPFYAGVEDCQYNIFSISLKNSDSILYLDNYGMQTLDKNGNPIDLRLNPDGGNIKTSQININPREIENLSYTNASVENYLTIGNLTEHYYMALDAEDIQAVYENEPTDLYLNPDGGDIHLGTSGSYIDKNGNLKITNNITISNNNGIFSILNPTTQKTNLSISSIGIEMYDKDKNLKNVLWNHSGDGNNNVALNATGTGLYLGYQNTEKIYFGPSGNNKWATMENSLITFNKSVHIPGRDDTFIDISSLEGELRIGNSHSLIFDRYGIQALDSSKQAADLYLNCIGGCIVLGPNNSSLTTNYYEEHNDQLYLSGSIETWGDIICGGTFNSEGGLYLKTRNDKLLVMGKSTGDWYHIYNYGGSETTPGVPFIFNNQITTTHAFRLYWENGTYNGNGCGPNFPSNPSKGQIFFKYI